MKIVASNQIEENQNKTQRLSMLSDPDMISSSLKCDTSSILENPVSSCEKTFKINYLAFQNLDRVNYCISTCFIFNDYFEACIVKFGNEDHHHPRQSV
jgi:hypothetical protein